MANYIIYLDANNLYGYGMSQPLATGDFNWETAQSFSKAENLEYYKNIPQIAVV